jgi:hypothetical protein
LTWHKIDKRNILITNE